MLHREERRSGKNRGTPCANLAYRVASHPPPWMRCARMPASATFGHISTSVATLAGTRRIARTCPSHAKKNFRVCDWCGIKLLADHLRSTPSKANPRTGEVSEALLVWRLADPPLVGYACGHKRRFDPHAARSAAARVSNTESRTDATDPGRREALLGNDKRCRHLSNPGANRSTFSRTGICAAERGQEGLFQSSVQP